MELALELVDEIDQMTDFLARRRIELEYLVAWRHTGAHATVLFPSAQPNPASPFSLLQIALRDIIARNFRQLGVGRSLVFILATVIHHKLPMTRIWETR